MKIFRKKYQKVIIAGLLIFNWPVGGYLKAQIDLRPGIRSVESTVKGYTPAQQIKLHIEFAMLYAKNNQWENFYEHLSAIYVLCPDLKNKRIVIPQMKEGLDYAEPEIIDPTVIKKLAALGLKDLNTQQKVLQFLSYLEPVCQKVCSPQ